LPATDLPTGFWREKYAKQLLEERECKARIIHAKMFRRRASWWWSIAKSLKYTSVDRIVKRPISTENAISALMNNLDKNKSVQQLEDGSPTPLTVTH
jgi:hypothetical protein